MNVLYTLLDTVRLYIIRGALFQRQSRPHPPLSQLKASFLSRVLATTAVPLKESQPPENSSSKINITTLNEYLTTY